MPDSISIMVAFQWTNGSLSVAICTPQSSVAIARTSLLGIMSILYVPLAISVAISQAAAPGLVEPCPLCEMNRAASWCRTVEVPSGLFTSLEVASANVMPDTVFPISPLPKSRVVITERLFWSRTVSPAAPPARTVPLPWMGVLIENRCSIIGVGRPSIVVIGSSQSSLVVFQRPIPPYVATMMWSPYSRKSLTMSLGRPAIRLPWPQVLVAVLNLWNPAAEPSLPIRPTYIVPSSSRTIPSIWAWRAAGVGAKILFVRSIDHRPRPAVETQSSSPSSCNELITSWFAL